MPVVFDYDPLHHSLIFTTTLVNEDGVVRFAHDLKADVAEGQPIVLCLFKEATKEQREAAIAKKRAEFFSLIGESRGG